MQILSFYHLICLMRDPWVAYLKLSFGHLLKKNEYSLGKNKSQREKSSDLGMVGQIS